MGAAVQIETVLDTDTIQISRHSGESRRLVVCFAGIGLEEDRVPKIEFANVATGGGADTALFIADPTRSWMNAPHFVETVVEFVTYAAAEVDAKEVLTLGHSLGGFAAMVLPAYYPIKSAVAFSPQYSVHPQIAADDPRWMEYRGAIRKFRIPELGPVLTDRTSYYVFHGDHTDETPQRERFPQRANLHHFIIPGAEQRVSRVIKRRASLMDVVHQCFDDAPEAVEQSLQHLNVFRRQAPG